MQLHVDDHSPIPIRRQLTEQLKRFIEGGGFPRDQSLPSIRELAGFLGINPNTVSRVIDDLKHEGYVQARRGKGVFVASNQPARPVPNLREAFLTEAVTQAAALGMTAEDLAVGVLSLAGVRPAPVQEAVEILLVECNSEALDFFARELEAHLPVRAAKVLVDDLAASMQSKKSPGRWGAAVTSFFHLPEVERFLGGTGVPVIALLTEVHVETLHRLAQLPPGTRVGVASADVETTHNLEHSIVNAGLPNIALLGSCAAEGAALGRLVRQVEVMVCSTPAAERVRALAGTAVQIIVDDRSLDKRGIEMLAAILVGQDGNRMTAASPQARRPRSTRLPRRNPPARGRLEQPHSPTDHDEARGD
jgi:DNA-binding transcriptional regulator YhcF (GntR family)